MPARILSKRNLYFLGAFALLFAFVSFLFFDQWITQSVTTKRHAEYYPLVRFLTDLGEGKYYFGGVLILGLLSWLAILAFKTFKSGSTPPTALIRLQHWSLYAFSCMLSAGICLQALKHLIGRQRPHVTETVDPHTFDFFTSQWHYHSMPSGHSQTLFTFATILWITFPKLPKAIFLLPALLAFTRLPLEEHFLSDIVVGALLGFAVCVLISARFRRIILNP